MQSKYLWIQCLTYHRYNIMCACPDCKVHGANMGPTWVLSAPDGPHVGPINLAIRVFLLCCASLWYELIIQQKQNKAQQKLAWKHLFVMGGQISSGPTVSNLIGACQYPMRLRIRQMFCNGLLISIKILWSGPYFHLAFEAMFVWTATCHHIYN